MTGSIEDTKLKVLNDSESGIPKEIANGISHNVSTDNLSDLKWFAENSDQVFWMVENHKLKYINPAFFKLTGLSCSLSQIPKSFLAIVHPDDKAGVLSVLYPKSSASGDTIRFHFRIIRHDHEIRWIRVESYKVMETTGNCIKRAGFGRDITEIKQYEDWLKSAKEKARESDNLKMAFLNNLNHEIRTPMNGIMGFSELLNIPDLSDKKRNYYTSLIISESKKLLGIVTDLIIASKTETNTIGFNKRRFSLNDTLYEVFNQFKQKHETEKLEFILHLGLENQDSIMYSGRDQLIQILHYLLSNAVKFTNSGHICLSYVLLNNKLTISVKDTGIGIDKSHHESIFALFRQVENTLDKTHGGNGLGLSIAKKLVNYLEGDIWLTSELKLGTTVYFTIPYIRD